MHALRGMPRSRQRQMVEAFALAATLIGSGTLLAASCLGREAAMRAASKPKPVEPPFVETTAAPAPPPTPSPSPPPPTFSLASPTPRIAPPPLPQDTQRLEAPAASATLTSADAGVTWSAPLSGMAAHQTYDPETNPVTPNAFGTPQPPPQVPRGPEDAGDLDGPL